MQCFLTGVKSKFGYQGKFNLEAYIDDGSLISLVKIDHNVSLPLSLSLKTLAVLCMRVCFSPVLTDYT
jgi:hypothetical protein